MERENADIISDLQDELIKMYVDLKAKSLFRSKSLSECWRNANTAAEYLRLSATVEPFLLAIPSSYVVEAVLSKQRNRLNVEESANLPLKLTNLQPNVRALVNDHQVHPSL